MILKLTLATLFVAVTALTLVSACGKSSSSSDSAACGASLPCTVSTNITN